MEIAKLLGQIRELGFETIQWDSDYGLLTIFDEEGEPFVIVDFQPESITRKRIREIQSHLNEINAADFLLTLDKSKLLI